MWLKNEKSKKIITIKSVVKIKKHFVYYDFELCKRNVFKNVDILVEHNNITINIILCTLVLRHYAFT